MPLLFLLALVAACSDYEINKEKEEVSDPEESEADPIPGLTVSPESIDAEGVCISVDREVTLTSDGEDAVQIQDIDIDGEGWEVEAPATPFDLEPGESHVLTVIGSEGEATLTITSDDVDDPVQTVTLTASADTAPEIALVSPDDSDILDSTDTQLQVTVSDLESDAEELYITWSSDVDGTIDSAFAESDGTSLVEWTGTRTSGDHTLTATVLDSCGNEGSLDVQVCVQAGYDVDGLDLSTWHFEGDSTWDSTNNWLQITDTSTGQVGSAFQLTPVSGDNVTIEFQFYASGGSGADGIALTALDTSRATSYLGESGGYLGYGATAAADRLPGWSIEFDTYENGTDPTSSDHIAFTFDGDAANPESWIAVPDLEDGAWHTVSIEVADPHVTVILDGTTYIDEDMSGTFAFPAYVGFSGATGSLTNYHLIDALTVTEYVCEEG